MWVSAWILQENLASVSQSLFTGTRLCQAPTGAGGCEGLFNTACSFNLLFLQFGKWFSPKMWSLLWNVNRNVSARLTCWWKRFSSEASTPPSSSSSSPCSSAAALYLVVLFATSCPRKQNHEHYPRVLWHVCFCLSVSYVFSRRSKQIWEKARDHRRRYGRV